jgi:hypothetical protein
MSGHGTNRPWHHGRKGWAGRRVPCSPPQLVHCHLKARQQSRQGRLALRKRCLPLLKLVTDKKIGDATGVLGSATWQLRSCVPKDEVRPRSCEAT